MHFMSTIHNIHKINNMNDILGSKDGFVRNALLLKDSKTACEDYHREMDGHGFANWFRKSLIPNIPKDSIILMDNASYHSMTTIPKCNSRVNDLRTWLSSNNISFPVGSNKKQLWELVKKEKLNPKYYIMSLMR